VVAIYPLDDQRVDVEKITKRLGSTVRVEISPLTEGGSRRTLRFFVHSETWVRVPIGGFMQVNHAVNRASVAHVIDHTIASESASALDLDCGAGNYSLSRVAMRLNWYGVEIDPAAISVDRGAAAAKGLEGLEVSVGDAASAAKRLLDEERSFDVVVANPPRAGLRASAACVARLADWAIVLCSCDTKAFARDLAVLTRDAWTVQSVTVFDILPHTRHVEWRAWLTPSQP
jgi:23S rRNA (uracil1939-C5)-methyltransferase